MMLRDLDEVIEYKFVILDENKEVRRWEGGSNHKIDFKELESYLNFLNKPYEYSKENGYNFFCKGTKYNYYAPSSKLIIDNQWQS